MINAKSLLIRSTVVISLILAISVAPALLLKYQLKQQLIQLGAEQVEIQSVYLNPWSGYAEIKGLSATATGQPPLKVGLLQTELRYRSLWNQRIEITQLQLGQIELHLQQQGQRWQLGPLLLPAPVATAETSTDDRQPSEWRAGLQGFELQNITTSFSNSQMQHQFVIDQAQLQRLHQWTPEQQTQFNLQGRLNGSAFAISTQGTPLSNHPSIELEIKLQALPLAALTKPWLDGLQGALSTDLTLQLAQLDNGLKLTQNGSLRLDDFALVEDGIKLSSSQIGWEGRIEARHVGQQQPHLISDGVLQLQRIDFKHPEIALHEQRLELNGRLEADSQQLDFSGGLRIQPLQITRQQLRIETHSGQWQGALGFNLGSAAITSFSGDANLKELLVTDQNGDALIALKQFDIKQMQLPQPTQLDAASVVLQQLVLGHEQPLLSLEQLQITDISGSNQRTRIGKIHPGAINARLDLDQNFSPYRWLAWLEQFGGSVAANETSPEEPAVEQEPAPEPEQLASNEPAPYRFKLDEFALQKPALIQISEPSAASPKQGRPYQATLDTLRLTQIDTTSDRASPFALKARAHRFGTIELDGDYALFAATPSGQWQGKIAGMELTPFSPLMNSQTGYQIDSGKLKLKTQGKIKTGLVDSSNQVEINNFIVSQAKKGATDEFDAKLGMPLKMALSLLTDSDDNVALELPISGKLSDPQFGIQSVLNTLIAKVTREAAVGYLTLTLQPYGALIGLTRLAVDAIEGSAINLEPVYFEPGSAELTPQGIDYLSKIATLLSERNSLRLKLCGQSVSADSAWLLTQRPQTAMPQASASAALAAPPLQPQPLQSQPLQSQPLQLSDTEQALLVQLAEERGFAVKEQLLTAHKINDDQLFNCRATVDALSESRPRVKIGL